MLRARGTAVLLLVLLSSCAPASAPLHASSSSAEFKESVSQAKDGGPALPPCFLSMGDWGYDDPHVASMGQYMNQAIGSPASVGCSSVQLTLALGDNFYNSGVDSVNDPMWDVVWVSQFRNLSHFGNMTVLPTMGDHDYAQLNPDDQPNHTRAEAQIQYHYEKDPLWYLPAANYTYVKDFGNGVRVKFLMVNTESLYSCIHLRKEWCFQPDHAEWIEHELSKSDYDSSITAVVIGGHHAVVCPLGGHYDPKLDAVMVPIARRHRVSLILTGHSHFVAWSSEADLTTGDFSAGQLWYIINGAGRGAGPYECYWNGLVMPVAKPANKRCFPFALSTAGAYMIHRVHPSGLEHCVFDSMNGTNMGCQQTQFRAFGTPTPTTAAPPAPPTSPPGPTTWCGACDATTCTNHPCPSADPYVCTAGPALGGCSSSPWADNTACTGCCDASQCP